MKEKSEYPPLHADQHKPDGSDPLDMLLAWEDVEDCMLLGSADDGTTTLEILLDVDVPADGVLHVVCASIETGLPHGVNDGETYPSAAIDDGSGVWTLSSASLPLIGLIRQTDPGLDWSLQVGSIARACTAGDLVAGQEVEITFAPSTGATVNSVGLLVWTSTTFVAIGQTVNFSGIEYGNGDSYPDFSADATTLAWSTDKGGSGWLAMPDADAHMITAMAAYPPQAGFVPAVGALIGEIATGPCSIACACLGVTAGESVDPGGVFGGSADGLAGNYQFDTGA